MPLPEASFGTVHDKVECPAGEPAQVLGSVLECGKEGRNREYENQPDINES